MASKTTNNGYNISTKFCISGELKNPLIPSMASVTPSKASTTKDNPTIRNHLANEIHSSRCLLLEDNRRTFLRPLKSLHLSLFILPSCLLLS